MDEVFSYLDDLLTLDDVVIMATSGGPDSMCLLQILVHLNKQLKIVVAHVNHKLRIEAEEEARFVESFAKSNNLIYEYMEIKEYNHDNLENEARVRRYEFFKSIVEKYNAKYLFTAHHSDDLMETILMRIVRGSSLKGYSGFKRVSYFKEYAIVRPLISVTKDDILEFMDTNHYKYYIDKSNFSKEYTRNRYRMDVLPFLKKENKNVHLKFLKFSEELDEANCFIEACIKDKVDKQIRDKNGLKIDQLRQLDNFSLKKVVEYELATIYVNDLFLVSDNNTEEIIKLIKSNKSSGVVDLPNSYQVIKDYNYLKLEKKRSFEAFNYVFDGYLKVPLGVIKQVEESSSKSNYVLRLDSKKISLPLRVRSRKNGDLMEVKNLNGKKKVKDIFIDEKISRLKRDGFAIVTDAKGEVLWLPGVKKSKFDEPIKGIYDIILSYEEE